jgi:hypothetical protein
MPKSTLHHPRMYPMRIQARGGSLVEQRYFSTIGPIWPRNTPAFRCTDDEVTLAISGVAL